jgi:tetratricopeptide (TPR) repeat protein
MKYGNVQRSEIYFCERTMKHFLAFFLALITSAAMFGESPSFKLGKDLYLFNKPEEAKPYFEKAISEDPSNELAYLYLGIVYEQLGDQKKAIAVLKRGLSVSSLYKEMFHYNLGVNYEDQREYTFAEQSYSEAIDSDPQYATAYLNRANARMKLVKYDGAVSDYTLFLQLKPQDPQRPQIEEVIRRLRLMQDAMAMKKAEEEAKQRALMNSVLDSLKNASEETKNVSVESLKFKQGPEDVDIED